MPRRATYLAARPFDFIYMARDLFGRAPLRLYLYCKTVVRLFNFSALKLFLYIRHEKTGNISKI